MRTVVRHSDRSHSLYGPCHCIAVVMIAIILSASQPSVVFLDAVGMLLWYNHRGLKRWCSWKNNFEKHNFEKNQQMTKKHAKITQHAKS